MSRTTRCPAFAVAAVFAAIAVHDGRAASLPFEGWAAFGANIGQRGFALADGTLFVTGAMPQPDSSPDVGYFHGLRWDPSASTLQHTYVHSWISVGGSVPTTLRTGDVLGAGTAQLVVCTANLIETYDVATMAKVASFAVSGPGPIERFAVGDLDGDGDADIALLANGGLRVCAANGTLQWQKLAVDSTQDILVAQLDADPALEIALSNGTVIDGMTHAVQASFGPVVGGTGFTHADVDADGLDELVYRSAANQISAFDVDVQQVAWTIPVAQTGAFAVGNVDGDAALELVAAPTAAGALAVIDLATFATQGSIALPAPVIALDVLDVVPGGASEIVLSRGDAATPHRFMLLDGASLATLYQSVPLEGPFHGPFRADLDGDHRDEIVVVSTTSDAGASNGCAVVFDAATMRVRAISPPLQLSSTTQAIGDASVADLDGDGHAEIVVAGGSTMTDSRLRVVRFDGTTQTFTYGTQIAPPAGKFFSMRVAPADVAGDAKLEIVAEAHVASGGPTLTGSWLYVFDSTTGAALWNKKLLSQTVALDSTFEIGNVDGDASPEIFVYWETGGPTSIIDAASQTIQQPLPNGLTAIHAVPGGFVASSFNGVVHGYAWNGSALASIGSAPTLPEAAYGISLAPGGILATASGFGTVRAYVVVSGLLVPIYASANYGDGFGRHLAGSESSGALRPISAGAYGTVALH